MGIIDFVIRNLFRKKPASPVDHETEVQAQTLNELFARSRVFILMLMLLLLVMRWALNAAFSTNRRLLALFVFLIVLSLVRFVMALIPSPLRGALAGARLQYLVFAAGVGLTSLALGALIALSWPLLDHVHVAILAAIITGIVASAVMNLGFRPEIYMLYVLPVLGAPFVMSISDQHPPWGAEILAVFFALFALIVLIISLHQSRTHRQAIELGLQLSDLAVHDTLTQLHNRRFLQDYMVVEGARLAREVSCWKTEPDAAVGVFMVDLDYFKEVNDAYGQNAGDGVLQQMAAALIATMRKSDVLVRWGGEEFVVIARIKHRDHVRIVTEKLRRTIEALEFLIPEHHTLSKTCSLGYCVLPFFPDSTFQLTFEQALGLAEAGLRIAKNEGRNLCVGVACGMKPWNEISSAYVDILHDLKRACAAGFVTLDRGGAAT